MKTHVTPVEIYYWWDQSIRLWTIQMRDIEGNQVDNSEWEGVAYEPILAEVFATIERLKKEHLTIKKISKVGARKLSRD